MSDRQSLVLSTLIAFAAGILAMNVVRDHRDSTAVQQLAAGVSYLASQEVCAAIKPGEKAIQTNDGNVIDCLVYDNVGYGSAPRLIRSITVPLLSHPLGEGRE